MPLGLFFVRPIGLEPTRRKTPDPKSGASANFATGAKTSCKGTSFFWNMQIIDDIFYIIQSISVGRSR